MSTDVVEAPGCSPGDDNFLAPLEVTDGQLIYLAITSFSDTATYTIEHSGSAELTCGPLSNGNPAQHDIAIYPNPMHDILIIEPGFGMVGDYELTLRNATGQTFVQKAVDSDLQLDVSHFPKGVYFAFIRHQKRDLLVKKIIRI